ncbi:MAG: hypothetical protein WCD24_13020 [Serratia inhibens]|uniref:hypothetical protein n=1 Tax=Serratia inhibens TaxID=2338073 RepID=UPI003C7AB5C8
MHAGNASNSAITGRITRPRAILFVALALMLFTAGVWGENKPAPHPTGIQPGSHTAMPDIFNSFKSRIKKQLRRLVAL